MVVVALLSVDLVESVDLVSADLVVNCISTSLFTIYKSLNYIKQNKLKDSVCLTFIRHCRPAQVLHQNECAILSVRAGVWEGMCQVGFQIDLT